MRRTVQLVKSLLALTVSIAVVVAVPVALVAQVGWPLPTVWPDLDTLNLDTLTRVGQTGVSDTFVINTLAIVVWIAWAQLAIALLVETVAAVRRHPVRALPVLPGLQPLAARLVATFMVVSVLTQPRASLAGTPLEVTLRTASVPVEAAVQEPVDVAVRPAASVPARPTAMVTAGVRDSWWQLAEHHLGDGLRWREIRDLNVDRRVADDTVLRADSDQLESGWELLVPVDERAVPDQPAATNGSTDERAGDGGGGTQHPEVWEVADGEHFWSIAQSVLTTAWGRQPTDAELTPYWRELVDTNRDALLPPHDPDLIHPGQRFAVPTPPADPAATTSPREPTGSRPTDGAAMVDEAGPGFEPPAEPAEPAEPTESAAPAAPTAPGPPGPDETDGSIRPWSAALQDAVQEQGGDLARQPPGAGPRGEVTAIDGWQAALEHHRRPAFTDDGMDAAELSAAQFGRGMLLPGVAASALAAAGAMSLLRRRRRAALQRRPAGYRLPTPTPDAIDEFGRLQAAAPNERDLDDLVGLLFSIPEGAQPALATTTHDGQVTLLFDDTAVLPDPPTPWTLHRHDGDGPVGWRAKLGAAGPSRSFGLPLLVTLGQTGSATVLANLGAIGTLQVVGPDSTVRRVLRTMSLELATSRTAGPVDVVVVGDGAFASVEDVRHVEDLAAELDLAIAEGAHGVVLADRLPRLLVCHAGQRVPTLPDHGVDGLVGVVTATPPPAAGWVLEVDDDQTGRLRLPDGGHVQLTLPAVRPEVIDTELDQLEAFERTVDAAVPDTDPDEAPDPDDPDAEDALVLAHPAGTSSSGQPPSTPAVDSAWCEVRLLGPVEVVRDGKEVEGLSPLLLEVLLYLATHRDGVTAERLDDAVWAGRIAPPESQRLRAALTKLRGALGTGPDGQPLLVRRRNATGHIRLSGHVGSDLDRALGHLARARDRPDALDAADEIAMALELVRGEPFEGFPRSWTSEVAQRAIGQLQDAATTAAAAYRQAGRYDRAENVIRLGLRLCDPCEPLYIQWAHLEAARGRREQIPHLLRQLRARYAASAGATDDWTVSTPTAETELAFETLMSDT